MPQFGSTARFTHTTATRASASALLCVIDGDEHWIPQSQIDDDSEVWKAGDRGTLVVSQWIAEQKGLV